MKTAWKSGLVLVSLVLAAGCGPAANQAGNAANTAGNAAGYVGNTVGNAARGVGNAVGNTVGSITGWGAGNAAGWPGIVNRAAQTIQIDSVHRIVDVRLAGTPSVTGPRVGWPARDMTGTRTAIAVPTGWTVRVSGPQGATWLRSVSIVPYQRTMTPAAGGMAGRAPATTWPGPNWTGPAGMAGTTPGATRTSLTATQPGLYAIVLRGAGGASRVLDIINVSTGLQSPSVMTGGY